MGVLWGSTIHPSTEAKDTGRALGQGQHLSSPPYSP